MSLHSRDGLSGLKASEATLKDDDSVIGCKDQYCKTFCQLTYSILNYSKALMHH